MAQQLEYNSVIYAVQRHEEGSKGSFFLEIEGKKEAIMTYSVASPDRFIIDHTEVSDKLRGMGTGKKLVMAAVEYARETGKTILPLCPFARAIFVKTPEIKDVWN
jgi:predicted GNAT family acetyltransferase